MKYWASACPAEGPWISLSSRFCPNLNFLIVGHGRIAETLAVLGDLMGFSITVNDPAADRAAFPHAERLVTEDFDLTETPIGPKSFVVIATQHKRDHLWLEKALAGQRRLRCSDCQPPPGQAGTGLSPRRGCGRRKDRHRVCSRRPPSRGVDSRGNRVERDESNGGSAARRRREV